MDRGIIKGNTSIACDNALLAVSLIEKNIKSLRRIEPYYDWIEIKSLLKMISNKNCD